MTVTQALGWALVHSLWQCALAAAGLAALLAVVPARAARARYALSAATLALTLALPVGTLVRLHPASAESRVDSAVPAAVAPTPAAIPRAPEAWLAGRRLRAVGTIPAPEPCVAALHRLAARLRLSRPVRLLQSAMVQVPAVLGWVRPVILLPASALTGLTPLQLEALLAHEMAHVRRYDYLVNLVQSVIETLLFYHPAVWWISARVRD